jgi:hypothetical protein
MDNSIVAASAAVLASLVGGAATIATASTNLSREELKGLAFARIDEDPVRVFSKACRHELRALERGL